MEQTAVLRIRVDQGNTAQATQAVAQALNKIGQAGTVSARQTAAAMRTLPAQFTDIATQLAGGQNPLLILLQQGGQIKDSFGGIGPAVRALAGFITPVSVAVAGLGAGLSLFSFAAYRGAEDSAALRDAIALTGNAAGLTEDRMQSLASSVKAASGQTVGAARDIVLALAKTGTTSSAVLESQALAVARIADLSGQAAEKVATQFAAQLKKPAEAAAKLNEAYNFLNLAQYKRIQQLENENRAGEAVRLTNELLVQNMAGQRRELGTLERTLESASKAWSDFWAAAKNVGRASTIGESIAAVQADLSRLRLAQKEQGILKPGQLFDALFGGKPLDVQIREAEQVLAKLQESRTLAAGSAATASASAETARRQIDAEKERQEALKAYLERVPKFLDDLRVANQRSAIQLIADERAKGEALIALDEAVGLERNRLAKLNAADRLAADGSVRAASAIARAALEAKLGTAGAKDPLGEFLTERALPADEARNERRMQVAQDFIDNLRDANERAAADLISDERERAERLVELDRQTAIRRAEAQGLQGSALDGARALINDRARMERKQLDQAESRQFGAVVFTDLRDSIAAALRDSRNPVQAFAQTLGNAVRQRVLDGLASSLVTSLVGKDGLGGMFSLGSLFGIDGKRAGGGRVSPYGTYLVGELGPELLQLGPMGGNVVPNGQLQRAMGAGGGMVVDQSINGLNVAAGVSRAEMHAAIRQAQARQTAEWQRSMLHRGA